MKSNIDNSFGVSGWTSEGRNCTQANGFTYTFPEKDLSSFVYGVLSSYHGGGYIVNLDLDLESAMTSLARLEYFNWVDRYTNLVVLEATMFNVHSRLFSRLKTYFEISPTGFIVSGQDADSTRLYPYVETGDYVTLAAQLLFIVIMIIRLVLFVHSLSQCRLSMSAGTVGSLCIQLIKLILGLGYIVCYVWRIDKTIYIIEVLMNNKGIF